MCCTCKVTAIIYWLWIWLVWHVGDCGVRVVGKMSKDIGIWELEKCQKI